MADGALRSPGFSHFHVKTHPEKLTVPIGGSVSVLGSNKYLCTGRLAQSADVGMMNGQSGPELMNHCLCCTRSIQREVEHQLNIRWRNQSSDCSLKSPLERLFYPSLSWSSAWQLYRPLLDPVQGRRCSQNTTRNRI